MSLSSLRSFSGAASLATTAFDTARTTLKAMAEAAAAPPGSEAAASAGASTGERPDQGAGVPDRGAGAADRGAGVPVQVSESDEAVATKREDAERTSAEKRKAGIRKGISLDAYA